MHHKFTKHGKASGRGGGCAKAIDYLLGERDHKGEERPDIQVLRGDPYGVAAVADTLDFSRTYTSGVISWAPEEAPTDEEISAVVDDWEKLAFSGLEPDRYAFTAVLHRENGGGVHVHTITARVDLQTGKALNIAPPGHQKDFDAFRDKWNHEQGWARPDDPLRKRLLQPDFEAYRTKPNAAKLKTELTECFIAAAAQGLISNAAELRQYAKEALGCEITRSSKDYLSLKPEGFSRAIRLKGEMYGDSWTREDTLKREAKASASSRASRGGTIDEARARKAQRDFDESCERRAEYNKKRYRRAEQGNQLIAQQAEPSPERPNPDIRELENPDAGRNGLDQSGASGSTEIDAERSDERLESQSGQDFGRSTQDAERLNKRLDSAHESEHGAAAERGRVVEQSSPKSVVETLDDVFSRGAGGGVSAVFGRWGVSSVLQLRASEDRSLAGRYQESEADLSRSADWGGVRGGGGQEIHLSEADRHPTQTGGRGIQGANGRGDQINDGTGTTIDRAAPAGAARDRADAERAPSRGQGLAAAAKRLRERMGGFSKQLFGFVQRSAERLRDVQAADRKRVTERTRGVQAADRGRISELKQGSGTEGGRVGPHVAQVRERHHGIDAATQRLNEAAKGLEQAVPALVARLEQQQKQKQGRGMSR